MIEDVDSDLDRLLRWAEAGGTWRVAVRQPESVTIDLCRCDGGEVADRIVTADPDVRHHLGDRQSSEE